MRSQNCESKGEVAIAVIGECQASMKRLRILWTIFLSVLVIVLALVSF